MKNAKLSWDNKNNPSSNTYKESYFSAYGGDEESKYVFLMGNDLPKRWQNRDSFTIAECGFGTGLNLLSTIELFQQSKHSLKNLYYISIENEPLCLQDLKKIHANYPHLTPYGKKLYEKYPPLTQGFHFIEYSKNIKILLCFNDADKVLNSLTCKVDAWFLDGFSPAKNKTMWSDKVFTSISHLSKINTTAATYTAARVVKDGFEKNGFFIEKIKGFGHKRHMLKAICKTPKIKNEKPWFTLPKTFTCKEKKALILGAGIAGCSLAYNLSKSGWDVEVLEKEKSPGMGASGNHCGVVAPLITKPNIQLGQMYQSAFLQSVNFYEKVLEGEGHFNGIKHYAYNKEFQNRWEIWKKLNHNLFTCKEDEFGKYFDIHGAGYIQPFKLCQKLLALSQNIRFCGEKKVENFFYENNLWQVQTATKELFQANVLILALGANSLELLDGNSFALQKIRGQITLLPKTLDTQKPICDKGYICPAIDNLQVIGASYTKGDEDLGFRIKDNQENLENIKKFLPQEKVLNANTLASRVSLRLSSNDRFPIIGAIHDEKAYKELYKSLPWTKHKPHLHKDAAYLPNLYISTAHGSRGLTSAILGANIITAMIENLPIPLEKELLHELHPARFTIRRIQKQEVW